jgi:peroxiredoxin
MTSLLSVDWSTIPAPEDDGAAKHLTGMKLPTLSLKATNGKHIDLSRLQGRSVIYAYPMTGQPDVPLPDGWDMIPGARGCTPQSCAFRDLASELKVAGASQIFGLSTQSTDYQREAAERLHLPFPLLSDVDMLLTNALKFPTLVVQESILLKRLTMVINNGQIEHIFYPIFPPDQNATDVVDWLTNNPVQV